MKKKAGAGLLFLILIVSSWCTLPAMANSSDDPGESPDFTAKLFNVEAAVHETFRYTVSLQNSSSQTQIYQLKATLPEGWKITYRGRGSQLTSINLDAGKKEDINLEIHPAYAAEPATYAIPLAAVSSSQTLNLKLEAVVTGAFGMELTTPTGRLSDNITEGKRKEIHLVVKNTGSLALNDISITAQTPTKWDATFEPSKIDQLAPGESADVIGTLKVPDKTIAGDYVTTFTAKNSESKAESVFRMTVKTSALSGWIGLVVIAAAIGLVAFLIRKYGRR